MNRAYAAAKGPDSEPPFEFSGARKYVFRGATIVTLAGALMWIVVYFKDQANAVELQGRTLAVVTADIAAMRDQSKRDHEFLIRQEGVNDRILEKLEYLVRGRRGPAPSDTPP